MSYKQPSTLKWDALGGNIVQIPKEKRKVVVKVWYDTFTRDYWLRRDRVIYKMFENSRLEILERYGKL